MGNVATNYTEVKNNIVKNFGIIFFCWTVGDIGKLTGPKISKDIKLIVLENNTATNDDDWYHNSYASTSYMCFAQSECDRFIYRKNYVSGMKAVQPYRIKVAPTEDKIIRYPLALYDAYLSCREVLSEYNHWENNVLLFYYDNNTLLKAKDSQGEPGTNEVWDESKGSFVQRTTPPPPGERKYYNNTYIATEEFLRKHLYTYWKEQYDNLQYSNGIALNEKVE